MSKSRIKCFLLAPTGINRLSLHRYTPSVESKCPVHDYHNASKHIGEKPRTEDTVGGDVHPHDDERWPIACDCGYEFTDEDKWQLFHEEIYRREDTDEEMIRSDAPVGAMYNATWMNDLYVGSDGQSLVVRTPGGWWHIDSIASNCPMPGENEHKCWVRHGEAPNITVDKKGNTCKAGGGSISQPGYHGFLRKGYLEEC